MKPDATEAELILLERTLARAESDCEERKKAYKEAKRRVEVLKARIEAVKTQHLSRD